MSGREAFGPNLRRIRVQRGISLQELASRTKVNADLWSGLERNDFSRWPGGIFARAYIREYAHVIGADPETTVDDFCRWFPQGDRRAQRIVRGQAELVGHELRWQDDLPLTDRRASSRDAAAGEPDPKPRTFPPRTRALIALADAVPIAIVAGTASAVLPVKFWTAAGVVAIAYQVCGVAFLGASPAVALADWYFAARKPRPTGKKHPLGLRVLRGSERVKV
jgi:transcriptional regulator with XRE-family HTH domain